MTGLFALLLLYSTGRMVVSSPTYFVLPLLDGQKRDDTYSTLFLDVMHSLYSSPNLVMERASVNFLLPNYKQAMECTVGPAGSCQLAALPPHSLHLATGARFGIGESLRGLLAQAARPALARSQLLLFTDIGCAAAAAYPDLRDLFPAAGDGLVPVLHEHALHLFVFWSNLTTSAAEWSPCEGLASFVDAHDPLVNVTAVRWSVEAEFKEKATAAFDATWDPSDPWEPSEGGTDQPAVLWLALGCAAAAFALSAAAFLVCARLRRRKRAQRVSKFAEFHATSSRDGPSADRFDLDPEDLAFNDNMVLGFGVAGKVYQGYLRTGNDKKVVAIKVAHVYAKQSARSDMVREIALMKSIGSHPYILPMLGCVQNPLNPMIVTEFCSNGDLQRILRAHPPHITPVKCGGEAICFDVWDIVRILRQVADAMAFLSSRRFVHRDLAARNVLLTSDLTPKVADFGLCRRYTEALYTQQAGKLPIKHMAIESIKFFVFDEKTDVWAFGILGFECLTGGAKAFESIENSDLLQHLEAGNRPTLPLDTPVDLKCLLEKCWDVNPSNRPTFVEIVTSLKGLETVAP